MEDEDNWSSISPKRRGFGKHVSNSMRNLAVKLLKSETVFFLGEKL